MCLASSLSISTTGGALEATNDEELEEDDEDDGGFLCLFSISQAVLGAAAAVVVVVTVGVVSGVELWLTVEVVGAAVSEFEGATVDGGWFFCFLELLLDFLAVSARGE